MLILLLSDIFRFMLHTFSEISLSLSLCVLCIPLHIVMHLCSVHFICQNQKMLCIPMSHVCV